MAEKTVTISAESPFVTAYSSMPDSAASSITLDANACIAIVTFSISMF